MVVGVEEAAKEIAALKKEFLRLLMALGKHLLGCVPPRFGVSRAVSGHSSALLLL